MRNYAKYGLIALGFAAATGLNIYVDKLQAQPTTSIQAPQPVPELTLKVTAPELDLISEGLQTQPFGKVVPLINKLRQQIVDQQSKPAAEAPKVEEKK